MIGRHHGRVDTKENPWKYGQLWIQAFSRLAELNRYLVETTTFLSHTLAILSTSSTQKPTRKTSQRRLEYQDCGNTATLTSWIGVALRLTDYSPLIPASLITFAH